MSSSSDVAEREVAERLVDRPGRVGESDASQGPTTAALTSGAGRGLPLLVWAIAGVGAVLLLALGSRYGFHRDEMYFIVAGRHPDLGYVDQPPLTPLLSAATAGLFGVTPLAVRLLPTLAYVVVVALTADIARRFGGSRTSQLLAAVTIAISGWLGAAHLDETTTFDVFFWTLAIWLFVPLLEGPGPGKRVQWRWLALGAVIGLALENKTLAIALPASVVVGLLMQRRWDIVRSPWAWAAALVAIALWAPNLVWQATHGFPQVTMAQAIAADQGGIGGRVKAIVELLALAGPLVFPVAVVGVRWLLEDPGSGPWHSLGWAVLVELGLMLVAGGKSYYSAGYLPLALAAGSIPLAGWLDRGRRGLRRIVLAAVLATSGTITALLLLPIVPAALLHATPIPAIYAESGAQVGWPELVAQVSAVAGELSPGERATAVIVTANYGEYAAIRLFGSNLSPAFAGHNSVWDWGRPGDGAQPVIVVGFGADSARRAFEGCRVVLTIDNEVELATEEQGAQIEICSAPSQPWSALWFELRHVN